MWTAGRLAYFEGYATGVPERRFKPWGWLYAIGGIGLLACVIRRSADMLQ